MLKLRTMAPKRVGQPEQTRTVSSQLDQPRIWWTDPVDDVSCCRRHRTMLILKKEKDWKQAREG